MDCSKVPLLRKSLDSEDRNGSDLETKTLDLESGTIDEMSKSSATSHVAPGMWHFPTNPVLCCIYRVPTCIRQVNPEAYTPQLLLIGPLHHSLKSQALKSLGDITNTKYMDYLNMEEHKKIYLEKFAQRIQGKKTIDDFRTIIEEDEEIIRASYSDSTVWIPSQEFVDMILHDSVFILEFILRKCERRQPKKRGDPLMDEHCLTNAVTRDLILLENQLPYFILEKLFDPIVPILRPDKTFRELIIHHFGYQNKIQVNSKFIHFTDLIRCVRVETLPDHGKGVPIENMHNADKLDRGGVNFEAVEEEFSLDVRFVKGCLKMPCLLVEDITEMILRNVMALEQCHYPGETHVCNYVILLDYLIETERDVDLLVEKGIIKNWIGQNSLVANVVNKLCLGITDEGSYYSKLAANVCNYYSNPINSSRAILKRVYFGNLWKGTATVTALLLLVLTLIQAVPSVLQYLH